jgi:hypothetical protein
MARPKRKPEEIRQYHVGVRLDKSEHEKIAAESEAMGVTISAYVRAKAMRGCLRIPKYAKVDTANMNQLSKLGGLLNKVHVESGGAYRRQTAEILEDIRGVILEIGKGLADDREAHSEP